MRDPNKTMSGKLVFRSYDPSESVRDVRPWVCEDSACGTLVKARMNPVCCPNCDHELMAAPRPRGAHIHG